MGHPSQFLREAQIILWLQWIFINAIGWLAGRLFILGQEFSMVEQFIIIGVFWGMAQWFLLRRYLHGIPDMQRSQRILWWIFWIVLTSLGAGLGQWVAQQLIFALPSEWVSGGVRNLLMGLVLGGLLGIIFGAFVGMAQFLLLVGRMEKPLVWILVNIVGWGIALQISAVISLTPVVTSLVSVIIASTLSGLWVAQLISEN